MRGAWTIPAVLALAAPPALAWQGELNPFISSPTAPHPVVSYQDIRDIQRRLVALGYDPGAEDGLFSAATRAAITAWQRDHGEIPDGQPSPRLEARLRTSSVVPGPGLRPPSGPAALARWRGLVGRPVLALGGGVIGHVAGVETGSDGAVVGTVVALDLPGGGTRRVPLAWPWMAAQLDRPQVLVPWRRGDVDWLVASGVRLELVRSLAGRRPSWLDGRPADLAQGGRFGVVDGVLYGADGQVVAVYVRRQPAGPDLPVPRDAVRVLGQGAATRVVIALSPAQIQALAPPAVSPPVADVPDVSR